MNRPSFHHKLTAILEQDDRVLHPHEERECARGRYASSPLQEAIDSLAGHGVVAEEETETLLETLAQEHAPIPAEGAPTTETYSIAQLNALVFAATEQADQKIDTLLDQGEAKNAKLRTLQKLIQKLVAEEESQIEQPGQQSSLHGLLEQVEAFEEFEWPLKTPRAEATNLWSTRAERDLLISALRQSAETVKAAIDRIQLEVTRALEKMNQITTICSKLQSRYHEAIHSLARNART